MCVVFDVCDAYVCAQHKLCVISMQCLMYVLCNMYGTRICSLCVYMCLLICYVCDVCNVSDKYYNCAVSDVRNVIVWACICVCVYVCVCVQSVWQ